MADDSKDEAPKPRKKIVHSKMPCTCLHRGGKRIIPDHTCKVTFHDDQVNEIFDELGCTSDILDGIHDF